MIIFSTFLNVYLRKRVHYKRDREHEIADDESLKDKKQKNYQLCLSATCLILLFLCQENANKNLRVTRTIRIETLTLTPYITNKTMADSRKYWRVHSRWLISVRNFRHVYPQDVSFDFLYPHFRESDIGHQTFLSRWKRHHSQFFLHFVSGWLPTCHSCWTRSIVQFRARNGCSENNSSNLEKCHSASTPSPVESNMVWTVLWLALSPVDGWWKWTFCSHKIPLVPLHVSTVISSDSPSW